MDVEGLYFAVKFTVITLNEISGGFGKQKPSVIK